MGAAADLRKAIGTHITRGQIVLSRVLGRLLDDKVGVPWKVDPVSRDLYPDHAADPGIGRIDNPVAFVALGHQGESGMEGALIERASMDGGGVVLVGLRDVDPNEPIIRPVRGNAYVELNGSAVLISTGGLWLETQSEITEDHEVLAGPSVQLPDGRYYVPLLLGPEKVYPHQEEATDAQDWDIIDDGPTEIVSLTAVNSYTPGVSTASFSVLIDNPANKATVFDVIIKRDGNEVARYPRTLTGNSTTVTDGATITTAVAPGVVFSLEVDAVGTHGQSAGWVRGTQQPTRLSIQQG